MPLPLATSSSTTSIGGSISVTSTAPSAGSGAVSGSGTEGKLSAKLGGTSCTTGSDTASCDTAAELDQVRASMAASQVARRRGLQVPSIVAGLYSAERLRSRDVPPFCRNLPSSGRDSGRQRAGNCRSAAGESRCQGFGSRMTNGAGIAADPALADVSFRGERIRRSMLPFGKAAGLVRPALAPGTGSVGRGDPVHEPEARFPSLPPPGGSEAFTSVAVSRYPRFRQSTRDCVSPDFSLPVPSVPKHPGFPELAVFARFGSRLPLLRPRVTG